MRINLREWLIYHLERTSDELSAQGTKAELEDMIDFAMSLFKWEFEVHHKKFKARYQEVMTAGFDENWEGSKKWKRIQDKVGLLSEMLAHHSINLGAPTPELPGELLDMDTSTIIPEEMEQDGLPEVEGGEDSPRPEE
jgi:hypothetical protein